MTPDRVWLAFTLGLIVVCWLWWTHRQHPADYGPEWVTRRQEWWTRHGRYCHACHGHGDCVHHRRGAGVHWRSGHEPDRALIGLCQRCHDLIHRVDHWFDRRLGFSRPIVLRLSTMLVLFMFLPWRIVRRPR